MKLLMVILLLVVGSGSWMSAEVPVSDFSRLDTLAREVVIARDVRKIPESAFAGCRRLKRVRFEDGSRCVAVGDYAFYCCASLEVFAAPRSLREIGRYAFAWCVSLREVSLGNVRRLGPLAFAYCSSIGKIDLPRTLERIGNNAFSNCSSLQEVVIPDSVKELESYAFSGCESLKEIDLPGSCAVLGELLVSGCTSLGWIRVHSPVPPGFECESFLFDPDEKERYEQCRLVVSPDLSGAYGNARGWSLFRHILENN